MSPSRSIALLPRNVLLISTLILSTLIAGCGGGGSGNSAPAPNSPLVLQPTSATIGAGTTQKFAATGGQQPYTYSVISGTGTIDPSGLFTAPASAGTATVRVTDAAGASSTASVTTNASLAMNAPSITMTASSGQSFQFSGTGGAAAGYQYSLVAGSGTITANGLYTVGNTPGKETVQVRDAQGTTASSTIQVLRVRTNGVVNSMAASGSALYLAGSFSAVNPYLTSRMAVLDASSGKPQLQCDLNTGFDAPVLEIVLFNNALYVGGQFTSYKGLPAHGLAKLDATTCALDTTFTQSTGFAGTSSTDPFQYVLPTYVAAVAASGSSLYVIGNFTSYRGLPANYLAKIDLQTGALDQNFTGAAGADGPLRNLTLSADSVYVAGNFSNYRGTPVARSAPVKIDINSGALDPAFLVTGLLSDVTALLYSGSSLYVAAPVQQAGALGGTVIKVDPFTGVQDSTFAAPFAQFGEPVYGMAASGHSLYVSGVFNPNVGSGPQAKLIKLDAATGQPDSSFNQAPSLDAVTNSFAISGSSIYVVGGFRSPGSQRTTGILKLDATTGSPDTTFGLDPGFGGTPLTVAVGPNAVYVGGVMSGYAGAAASNIAKIDATSGTPDAAFDMADGPQGPVYKILISGSSLYIGGWFYQYGDVQCGLIAKADANTGSPDPTFMHGGGFELNPYLMSGYGPSVNALAISGTSLYVGGHFTGYRGQVAGELAKLDVNSGELDTTFVQGQGFLPPASPGGYPPDSRVFALTVTQNGLYVGGNFQQYRGTAVGNLLKLDPTTGNPDLGFMSPFSTPSSFLTNMTLLASGSNLYVGSSNALSGSSFRTGVSKLDAQTGAVDATFATDIGLTAHGIGISAVTVINDLVLSGSSLYVAGDFTRDLVSKSSTPTNGLIKVDATTGELDTTFSQPGGPDGAVGSLLLEAGSLYVGGSFLIYRNRPATFSAVLDPASGANRDVAAF